MIPIKLVTPPTIGEEAKQRCIAILEEALAEAKRGEISELMMICKRAKGEWSEHATPTQSMTDWIGKIEILKHNWIALYETVESERYDE